VNLPAQWWTGRTPVRLHERPPDTAV